MKTIEQFSKNLPDNLKQHLEDIDFFRQKDINSNRQSLWHAIHLKNIHSVLKNNKLDPYTSHRYWADGKRRKEDDPLYEDSFWMYGWSMTRKKEYAFNWNGIVLELDTDKIAHNFEIMPISWNNLFTHNKTFQKKEFEEFVIAHYEPRSIATMKKQEEERHELFDNIYTDLMNAKNKEEEENLQGQIDKLREEDKSWIEDWRKPRGKSIDLKKCLKGIYLDKFNYDILMDSTYPEQKETLEMIITHPLFKGLFEAPHTKEKKMKKMKF